MNEPVGSESSELARTRHHRRNTLLLGAVEVGWGPAMAFLDPSSILPVLLGRLGASYTVLSFLPTIRDGASFPFELLSPYATERLPRKRLLVWALHCVIPLVWACVGAWLLLGDTSPGPRSLAILYAGFFVSTALTGFLIPLWYDYMGKITDPLRRGSAFSTIFALQSVAGCAGAFLAQGVLEGSAAGSSTVLAPPRFALCYFLAAATAMLGNQAFLWTVEDVPEGQAAPRPRVADYLKGFRGFLREDHTLRRYILVRAATRLGPIVATYYSVQAVARFGRGTPVAFFALALIAGKLMTSLFSWRFADAIGMKPFLVGGVVALAAAGGVLVGVERAPQPALGLAPYLPRRLPRRRLLDHRRLGECHVRHEPRAAGQARELSDDGQRHVVSADGERPDRGRRGRRPRRAGPRPSRGEPGFPGGGRRARVRCPREATVRDAERCVIVLG